MQKYILQRLLQAIPLLLLVTFLSYSLILLLPGDPVLAGFTGGEETLTPEAYEMRKHALGLDKPIVFQYADWLGRTLTGDFGTSTLTRRPVADDLAARVPITLQIGAAGLIAAVLFAIPAGVVSAVWRNSWIDRVVTLIAVGGVAIPDFWFAIMLILLFSVGLGILPPVGFVSPFEDPIRGIQLMLMPTLVLGWSASAVLARQTRSSMLEVLRQDYVRTARAKGLHQTRVVFQHALRNALLPTVTVLGLLVGRLVAGTVIVETVFSIPGTGRLLIGAVFNRDFPTVQAIVTLIALTVVAANLLTDLVYAWLDPRIRYA